MGLRHGHRYRDKSEVRRLLFSSLMGSHGWRTTNDPYTVTEIAPCFNSYDTSMEFRGDRWRISATGHAPPMSPDRPFTVNFLDLPYKGPNWARELVAETSSIVSDIISTLMNMLWTMFFTLYEVLAPCPHTTVEEGFIEAVCDDYQELVKIGIFWCPSCHQLIMPPEGFTRMDTSC